MSDTCPTCGGPRQSFYVAGYERAEAKQAGRVAELEAALRQGIETMRLYMAKANNDPTPVTVEIERFGTFPGGCFNSMSGNAALRFIELAQRALKGQSLD